MALLSCGLGAEMSFQWKALDCKGSQVVPDARWGATFTPLDNSKVATPPPLHALLPEGAAARSQPHVPKNHW